MTAILHIGLVINPLAGLGGSLGLKGSDGEALRERVGSLTEQQRHRALERVERALQALAAAGDRVRFSTWGGEMGEKALLRLGLPHEVIGRASGDLSVAQDTRRAARELREHGVDLILFGGGDGTARDIFDVVGSTFPVLGIPAGVKMHSGVFAVSPEAAGELLLQLVRGGLVGLVAREVRDIDEEAFRHDQVRSRFYGEMLVPGEGRYLQHTKVGGRESPELVADDIADWLVEQMEPGRTYLIGPGSTTAAIMDKLGLANTLLGVDVVRDGQLLASDVDEARLLELLEEAPAGAAMVVTVIGGQGSVFGRGNQQFSPQVIRKVGLENILVVAAKSKIAALEGRPLLVDTNDPALDRELCGWRTVITGYDDRILYRIATA
ncbi:MAG: ATP-NAD kinase family protein [Pseudomonadales bacterium]|nr:ATP-NAD kinase family protein [Pseudomonadales bacterium]